MKFTNLGLVDFCKKAVEDGNWVYLMGTIGQTLSQDLLNEREKANPHKWYTNSKVANIQKLIDTANRSYRCVDCVGMIKCYYWGDYGTGNASGYNASSDWSADYMWNHSSKKGPIALIPETPGVAVWMSGHIGVYIGNGMVIESTPNTKYSRYSHGLGGPCITKLTGRNWTGWLKIPFIEYEEPIISNGNVEYKNAVCLTSDNNIVDGTWIRASDGIRWWFRLEDGNYPADCFMVDAKTGKTYCFDHFGYMRTGWVCSYGEWYYFDTEPDNEGAMLTSRLIISPGDGNMYYLKNNGKMAHGEIIEISVSNTGIIS